MESNSVWDYPQRTCALSTFPGSNTHALPTFSGSNTHALSTFSGSNTHVLSTYSGSNTHVLSTFSGSNTHALSTFPGSNTHAFSTFSGNNTHVLSNLPDTSSHALSDLPDTSTQVLSTFFYPRPCWSLGGNLVAEQAVLLSIPHIFSMGLWWPGGTHLLSNCSVWSAREKSFKMLRNGRELNPGHGEDRCSYSHWGIMTDLHRH